MSFLTIETQVSMRLLSVLCRPSLGHLRSWVAGRMLQVLTQGLWGFGKHFERAELFIVVTRSNIPAGIAPLHNLMIFQDWVMLIDKMSRLWTGDDQWARGLFRALADMLNLVILATGNGAGLGRYSAARLRWCCRTNWEIFCVRWYPYGCPATVNLQFLQWG